ncbi:nutritionally-regulated adipose and cardiac enriched protein homolog isoform X1 [Desmodus rotundus]|uniref:nutritionally-regulated adipose and cardiac enriched protein homolog isoform X1 n=1 Tax=Desmodus rotundus TaxID=9430 RepID=UPI0023816186|nr:nutritionally-regulated adipose and cardiac enriched protein homolog isoform X1 [Desmodus rotundus]XP_053784806.1 nutritionally-regulated adipose and cardiac enriched protein homolog isoform X1 [Desmodus rotundus]XP_053784807.1 nutritionally-regulated adipose and cardiac enriched protein homolog isoform X1 [Desmodus rotundus]XP_053784808.1 nutritionally-regulated adipose and cardiac enriched protein homolog isoform X1 [Desmodus rotundus]XP_053784809.1 nutritionally-regulated adipose and card
MRTAAGALSPDSQPETRRQTRKNVAATVRSPTPWAGREGDRKCPPSILRRSQPERPGRRTQLPRTSKRVRFHEPVEVAVHFLLPRHRRQGAHTRHQGALPALAPRPLPAAAAAAAVAVPAAGTAAGPVLRPRRAHHAGPGEPAGPAPRPHPAPPARGPCLLALLVAAVTAPKPVALWAGPREPRRVWSSTG